jgi:AraC-like DNA-binding protein
LDKSATWAAFASPSATVEANGLACLGAGEQSGAMRPFRDRSLTSHGIVVVSEGRGAYVDADHRIEPVTGPALIWLYPGIEHGYGPDAAGWREHWILFSGASARIYSDLGLTDPRHPVVRLGHTPGRLSYLFLQLRTELSLVGGRSQLRTSLLTQQVLEAALAAVVGDQSSSRSTAIDDLEASALVPLSIEERARRVGLSVGGLRTLVREATGLTPVEFILEVRLARARTLLAETRHDIRTVASEVGYDDPAYFSRVFASRAGVSPSAFRQQQYRGLG